MISIGHFELEVSADYLLFETNAIPFCVGLPGQQAARSDSYKLMA